MSATYSDRKVPSEVRIKKYAPERLADIKETARQTRLIWSRGFSSEQTRYAMNHHYSESFDSDHD